MRIPQSDHPIPISRTVAGLCALILIGGSVLFTGLAHLDRHFGIDELRRQEAFRSVRTASMEQGR